MTRTITLTKKASTAELTGLKLKVATAIAAIGSPTLVELRKRCVRTMNPKVLRARVRELHAMKLVSVKVAKAA